LAIRTTGSPAGVLPLIQQTIRATAPEAGIDGVTTMTDLTARELSRPRTAAAVATLFALVAIALAAVGVYGVVAYDVRQRWREFAVRAALGAGTGRISRDVTWRSLGVGLIGLLVGLAAAFAVTRTLTTMLYQVDPGDPMAFVSGALLLAVIVVAASYLPARRAAASDPATILRD
jgi:putative ABC transport system permease protein